jgi:integrase
MKRNGYAESTIRAAVKTLRHLARNCNLLNPESFLNYNAVAKYGDNRRCHILDDVARFYKSLNLPFQRPRHRVVERLPFIPLEAEIDALIAAVNPKTSVFMRIVKETWARAGEVWALKWTDFDLNRGTVIITPEKGSRPRLKKLKAETIAALLKLPRLGKFVFHKDQANPHESYDDFFRYYAMQRAKIADKLQNQNLRRISFKTLRHFGATKRYWETKDILHVMQELGHRSIKNTLIYTQLVKFESDEFLCKVAKTVEEAKVLIEDGFDYVTQVDDVKLFRKRK